jgi:hypothetical protein
MQMKEGRKDQTIEGLSEGWIRITNRWGSKVISMDRLIEITPWPGDADYLDEENGQALLTVAIDREIAAVN